MSHTGTNKYNKLAKNTVIFFLGNFGSKIISFIIVPFYTYVLSTAEYGTVDLFTTTINILIPFLILGLNEAVIRFLTAKEIKPEIVASNCFMLFASSMIIIWALYPAYRGLNMFQGYSLQFVILLSLMAFNQIYLQYLRGTGLNVAFALNGIIITFVTVTANCICLLVLDMGVAGYLYSLIFAQLAGAIEIVWTSKLWNKINFKYIDKKKLKEMLIYCVPLIPNALMWWAMSVSDKYMITFFVGVAGNGIYSVAHKIPTVIQMFYSVFMQAWQISAIEEGNSKDRSKFYSNIYKYLLAFLVLSGSAVIVIAKPLYVLVMSGEFKIAWRCVPLLIIANIFSCLSSFFGTTYVVNKQSKKAFYTTFIGAAANIVFNFIFIYFFGIAGAAIGTLISYFLVSFIRSRDTYKYVGLKMKFSKEGLALILLLLQHAALILIDKNCVYIIEAAIFSAIVLLFRKELLFLIDNFKKIVMKKLKHKR